MDGDASARDLTGGGDVMKADDTALPPAYGSDTLELMMRDPTWAHAYWDISVERIPIAIGRSGGEEAFLRLIGLPAGHLIAEHAVPARRGSRGLALPEADRSYMVELAVMHNYRWMVLARSGVVHAPPAVPVLAGADLLAVGLLSDVGHWARTPGSSLRAPSDRL